MSTLREETKNTNGDAGLVGGLTSAGFTRPSGEADALTATAFAITRTDFIVDAVAREVVALAVLAADDFSRVAAGLALANTAETVTPIAAENVRGVVHLAERFELRYIGVAGALAVLSAAAFVAHTNSALQVAAVVALFGIGHETLHQEMINDPIEPEWWNRAKNLVEVKRTEFPGDSQGQSQAIFKWICKASLTPTG